MSQHANRRLIGVATVGLIILASCSGIEPSAADAVDTFLPTVGSTTVDATSSTAGRVTSTTGVPTTTSNSMSTTIPATTTTMDGTTEVEISIGGGAVDGGGRIAVVLDSAVRLSVTSDTNDEVHLHGYDLFLDVTPGVEATIEFIADIPGIFEVELEGAGLQILELVVEP